MRRRGDEKEGTEVVGIVRRVCEGREGVRCVGYDRREEGGEKKNRRATLHRLNPCKAGSCWGDGMSGGRSLSLRGM